MVRANHLEALRPICRLASAHAARQDLGSGRWVELQTLTTCAFDLAMYSENWITIAKWRNPVLGVIATYRVPKSPQQKRGQSCRLDPTVSRVRTTTRAENARRRRAKELRSAVRRSGSKRSNAPAQAMDYACRRGARVRPDRLFREGRLHLPRDGRCPVFPPLAVADASDGSVATAVRGGRCAPASAVISSS